MVPTAKNYLMNGDIDKFGMLMHDSWKIKRDLSTSVTNKEINELYEFGLKNGAIGGKILGAGGGGFLLFTSKEGETDNLVSKLISKNMTVVPFTSSNCGTKIVYSEEPA